MRKFIHLFLALVFTGVCAFSQNPVNRIRLEHPVRTNSVLPPTSPAQYIIVPLNIDPAFGFEARDGAALVSFNNQIRILGGWNPLVWSGKGLEYDTDRTNNQWVSTNGYNYTKIDSAAFPPVHCFGYGLRSDSSLWVFGSDIQGCSISGTAAPVYSCSPPNAWTTVTLNAGPVFGQRVNFAFCIHNNYMYVAGGVSTVPAFSTCPGVQIIYRDVIRSMDGITWTHVGNLDPSQSYFGSSLISKDGKLILIGGGTYLSTPNNTIVQQSDNNGFGWRKTADFIDSLGGTFQSFAVYDNKIFMRSGSRDGVTNTKGLYYSSDLARTWQLLYDAPIASHAAPMVVFRDTLYFASGNLNNFTYKLYRASYYTGNMPSAVGAYSLRKIYPAYSGSCITVRRSSDNDTLSVGYVSGYLDTVSLKTFVGAGNGFLHRWFDCSGNGNTVTQTVTANQYQIVNSGSLYYVNSKPAVYVGAKTKDMFTAANVTLSTKYSYLAVCRTSTLTPVDGNEIFGGGGNTYGFYYLNDCFMGHNSGACVGSGNCYNGPGSNYLNATDQNVLKLYKRDLNVSFFNKGYSFGDARLMSCSATSHYNSLSGEASLYNFLGYFQELVVFNGDAINDFYNEQASVREFYNAE